MDYLLSLDQALLKLINQTWSNSYFDIFFPFITDLHKTWPFKIILVLFAFGLPVWKYGRKGILVGLCLFASVGLSDWSGNEFFKKPINRNRPFQVSELQVVQRSTAQQGRSFISNHAANMTSIAAVSFVFIPPSFWFLFICALLAAYSRVYNGVHFPSDVMAGALWGFLVGWSLSAFTKKKFKIPDWKKKDSP